LSVFSPAWSARAHSVLRLTSLALTCALLAGVLLGCHRGGVASSGAGVAAHPVDFAFADIDGQTISDERVAGRVTVLLFATTFDLNSQAQAKFLEDAYRTHAPRINAVLVLLEPPKYVDLARSYRDILRLSYPVALADQDEVRSSARFPSVRAVPTWIVLDRNGRVEAFQEGNLDADRLEQLLGKAE
jgi:hypothetical protein